jgi:Spy/CpxP family protein refolding chaperone
MRALKIVPALLALTLAVPAFAAPGAPAKPPAAAAKKAGAKKDRGAKNDARLLEALKRQGIEEARAKKVVAVVSKYRTEKKPVHEDARTHRQNLRRLNESSTKDEAAIQKELDALKASREKLEKIHDREIAELNTILKPSERAKVMEVMQRGKHKHGAKGAKQAAKNKTQRANG